MKTNNINITQLNPAEYNPRVMSTGEYNKLKNSLDTFGLVDPIIVDIKHDNTIIGGHQRYQVLYDEDPEQELQLIPLGDVGLVIKNTDIKIQDVNDQKALNLALNKITGDWDYNKLDELLVELHDANYQVELTGFDEVELQSSLLGDEINKWDIELTDDDVVNEDDKPQEKTIYICPNCGKELNME